MSSDHKLRQLLIDQCRSKYSWAAGATRGSPLAIEWHRRDLNIAFAEINGLMASLHYQDKAESSKAQAASLSSCSQMRSGVAASQADLNTPKYPTALEDEDIDHLSGGTVEDHPSAPRPFPGPAHQPMAPQWAAIRSLREEMAFHHKRFELLVKGLGDPIISNLLRIYPDAQSVHNKGAQLVKDVLEGFRPRELSLVFAFVSFSYSITQLLYKKGCIDKSDILTDLHVWRNLISDSKERYAFNLIAEALWPEAKDHLHFIPIRDSHFPSLFPVQAGTSFKSAGYPRPSLLRLPTIEQIPGAVDESTWLCPTDDFSADHFSTDDFSFGIAASHTALRDEALGPNIVDYLRMSNETFNSAAFSSLENPSFSEQPPGPSWTQPTETESSNNPTPRINTNGILRGRIKQPQSVDPEPTERKLEDTALFLVVLVFLQDIAELVYILSGRSVASRRYKLYKVEERDQEAFLTTARATFFQPREDSQGLEYPAFPALLSVAEKFTEGGLLRSIAEIKHYLVSVATVSLSTL